MSLKPTPPHDAKNRYLNDKKPGVTKKTLKNYRTTTRQFCDWLDERGITDLNDLDSEVIQRYKEHRLSNVKVITARQDMMTLKQFIEFREHIQAVPRGMADMVRIPRLAKTTRYVTISSLGMKLSKCWTSSKSSSTPVTATSPY